MKASEYYEKYKHIIDSDDDTSLALCGDMFVEFSTEASVLFKSRNGASNSALIAVLKEQNQKWNKVCNLFMKNNNGLSPIKHDGFILFWDKEMPSYKLTEHTTRKV